MPTSETREALRRRPDVPDHEIDDVIERAAALQDASRAHERTHATTEEVAVVAAELDIAPEYVDQAIAALRQEKQAAAAATEQQAKARAGRFRSVGLAAAALAVASSLTLGTGAALGAARLGPAALEVEQTEARLDAALDRQVALAPQLTALAGADATAVKAAADAGSKAETVPGRLEAAAALNQAMAEAIGRIQADGDEQAQQRLLNLQYEVVGTWNRIETERGRHDEALTHWEHVASGLPGRLALATGLSRPPG